MSDRAGMPMQFRALRGGTFLLLALVCLSEHLAQYDGPALPDEEFGMDELVDGLSNGSITLQQLRRMGLIVFTTPFNTFDGYGDGSFDNESPSNHLGHRPTLQGNGLSLRVNGLDAQSCNECHSFVSQSTRPPTLGIGGVGGIAQNAMIFPSLIDVADSSDDRVYYSASQYPDLAIRLDGTADFNGRFANPPFLFGGGGVELLAKEMTADLQQALVVARASPAGTITDLRTHGVDFGTIETLSAGQVELHVEGIGFQDNDGRPPEEVLVVRPFGRKGENFSMRDFDRIAMQFHFGLQPVEVVGEHVDGDGDGVVNEATIAEMSVLHVFDVTNPVPFVERLDLAAQDGFGTFLATGCATCHVPVLKTRSRHLPLSHPEVPAGSCHERLHADRPRRSRLSARPGGGRRPRAAVRRPEAARHGRRSGGGLRAGRHLQSRVHHRPPVGGRRHRAVPARRAAPLPSPRPSSPTAARRRRRGMLSSPSPSTSRNSCSRSSDDCAHRTVPTRN